LDAAQEELFKLERALEIKVREGKAGRQANSQTAADPLLVALGDSSSN
jgi:hypothetical protein